MKARLENIAAVLLLTALVWIFRFIRFESLESVARPIGTLGFVLTRRYRERIVENLHIGLGDEKDSRAMDRLIKEIFFHLACTICEFVSLLAKADRWDEFLPQIEIRGREHLDKALQEGNGVIALGMHLGGFFLVPARIAVEKYPCHVVINRGRNLALWKKFEEYHHLFGVKTIYTKPSVMALKKSLKSLSRNEIIYILIDEQQRRRGIATLFFGRKAFTSPGPAFLSIKTGAIILPMYVLRTNEGAKTLVIEPPVTIHRTGDEGTDIELLTAQFTQVIEQIVRRYPNQWTWLNRRWKSPPLEISARKETAPFSNRIN
jgi:KDO2-lipid IV(A) lauroyltransferase